MASMRAGSVRGSERGLSQVLEGLLSRGRQATFRGATFQNDVLLARTGREALGHKANFHKLHPCLWKAMLDSHAYGKPLHPFTVDSHGPNGTAFHQGLLCGRLGPSRPCPGGLSLPTAGARWISL